MPHHHLKIHCPPAQQEIWIARLSQWEANGFEEVESGLSAYFPNNLNWAALEAVLQEEAVAYTHEVLPDTNWNALWESQFEPIQVDDFSAVRADFHPANPQVQYDLVINPKMAFGTGHHATTYQMIRQMRGLDFEGKRVFDYGCGTGVLAILAEKMGAAKLIANDISPEAVENTLENMEVNGVSKIQVLEGDLSIIQPGPYDIILANINRNVILDSLSTLYEYLAPKGKLLLSGILLEDEALLLQQLESNQFHLEERHERDSWLCLQVTRL